MNDDLENKTKEFLQWNLTPYVTSTSEVKNKLLDGQKLVLEYLEKITWLNYDQSQTDILKKILEINVKIQRILILSME